MVTRERADVSAFIVTDGDVEEAVRRAETAR
jgi:hypothetical protein